MIGRCQDQAVTDGGCSKLSYTKRPFAKSPRKWFGNPEVMSSVKHSKERLPGTKQMLTVR